MISSFLREFIVTQSHIDINNNNNAVAYPPTTREIGRYLGVVIKLTVRSVRTIYYELSFSQLTNREDLTVLCSVVKHEGRG